MTYDELKKIDAQHYMKTFGVRLPVVFTGGNGAVLSDAAGKEYIDFLAGIAVNCLGYSDAGFASALKSRIDSGVIHTCNYFHNEPQALLAQLLCEKTGFDRVFFANSGAEANECAIKIAKKYAYQNGRRDRFVTLKQSFHGRTLATLTATGQEKFHEAFTPMVYDFSYIDANDMEAAKSAITADTCGVMLEVIQGESGVFPLDPAFLRLVRDLCTEHDIPLIIDEVQTGMGRTGKFLAQEHYGVKADITTLAKALGNGVPVGACLASGKFADAFGPGDHGSTFGGNPLACEAGLYVTQKIDAHMLGMIEQTGAYFKKQLLGLMEKFPDVIADVRGMGLMLGAQLSDKAETHTIQRVLIEHGFVIGTAGANTLRFVPPYIITQKQIDCLISALHELFQ